MRVSLHWTIFSIAVSLAAMASLPMGSAFATVPPRQSSTIMETISPLGGCTPGEPGLGDMYITYDVFPQGTYSVADTVAGVDDRTVAEQYVVAPDGESTPPYVKLVVSLPARTR